MVALTVIGVITSIILPVALQTVPDENVMKFKKGNAILAKVINELVSSGEYYTVGDLGMKPNGELINGDHRGDYTYFCKSFADMLNTKSINCSDETGEITVNSIVCSDWDTYNMGTDGTQVQAMDKFCKTFLNVKSQIISSDGIVFYETASNMPFGWDKYEYYLPNNKRLFLEPVGFSNERLPADKQINEIDTAYRCKKVFCMDVDGIDSGEEPFGYGIRADGKILLGKRAQEWLNKSIQEK